MWVERFGVPRSRCVLAASRGQLPRTGEAELLFMSREWSRCSTLCSCLVFRKVIQLDVYTHVVFFVFSSIMACYWMLTIFPSAVQ